MASRVLIVEDSPTQAAALSADLESAGYEVAAAANGAEGIDRFEAGEFDLVVSDIVMPGEVDGYALCRRLKTSGRDVPVVLLTNLADPMDIIHGLESGADNFITKPYDKDSLLSRISLLLATREARQRNRLTAGVQIYFMGREYVITSEREQILDLLVTTFEEAVCQNRELRRREEELTTAKAQLDRYAKSLEARLESILSSVPDVLFSVTADWQNWLYVSPASRRVFGCPADEMSSSYFNTHIHPDDQSAVMAAGRSAFETGSAQQVEYRFTPEAGRLSWINGTIIPVTNGNGNGNGRRLDGIARDVTEQKHAETELRRKTLFLELLQFVTAAANEATEFHAVLRLVVEQVCRRTGWPIGHVYLLRDDGEPRLEPSPVWHLDHPERHHAFRRLTEATAMAAGTGLVGRVAAGGAPEWINYLATNPQFLRRGADLGVSSGFAVPVFVGRELVGVLEFFHPETVERDAVLLEVVEQIGTQLGRVAERERAQRERESSEQQIRQTQKMEAVGRLAGGIAHDFNNLLTVIMGEIELGQERLKSGGDVQRSLDQVKDAADRAALLTRQLLIFSRREIVQPRLLALNEVVENLNRMLHRLIGEDLDLTTRLEPALWVVRADRGQIEQVLVNLAVNARDAMPDGGSLIIETANVTLGEAYLRSHADVAAGEYAMLAVSDSGTGMTPDVKAHLFEPFFTTKDPEKGTGLGLATSYGIVKQNGGYITCYSELGIGSTFKIYLPRVLAATPPRRDSRNLPMPGGSETVLVVEDDAAVRDVTSRMLEGLGYRVHQASLGLEALALLEQHGAEIDLLLTDVVLPGIGGRTLAERALQQLPKLKVLFASGYTDDVILQHRLLAHDVSMIQKPFTPAVLARKVREALDRTAESPTAEE